MLLNTDISYIIFAIVFIPMLFLLTIGLFNLTKIGCFDDDLTEDDVWNEMIEGSPDEIEEFPFTEPELNELRKSGL